MLVRLQLLPQHSHGGNAPQLGTQEGHMALANRCFQVWRAKEEAGETNGLLALKLTSCRYMVEAFKERTGQVLGNWTQKEGQLSIACQCMEFDFKKAELRVSCLNIST